MRFFFGTNSLFRYMQAAASRAVVVVVFILSLVCCGGSPKSSAPEDSPAGEIVRYIPSDACAIVLCERLGPGLERLLDPESVFRSLPLESVKDERMAISYHYLGELTPMLAVELGRKTSASSEIETLMAVLPEFGLQSRFVPRDENSSRSVLLISESEPLIEAAVRHNDSRTSVLDVEGIPEALSKAGDKGQVVLWRGDAVSYLLPKDFLSRHLKLSSVTSFLKNFASWTIMRQVGAEEAGGGEYLEYEVSTVHSEAQGASLFEGQPSDEVRLTGLLPQGASFVVDQSFESVAGYLSARSQYLDARGSLNSSNNRLAKLKKSSGVDPKKWATDLDIKEIAKVKWRGQEVLLVRPSEPQVAHNIKYNKRRGFVPALFGDAYAISNDSYCACIGNWILYGSSSAIKHFLSAELKTKTRFAAPKESSAVILADDLLCSISKDGIRFQIYRQY